MSDNSDDISVDSNSNNSNSGSGKIVGIFDKPKPVVAASQAPVAPTEYKERIFEIHLADGKSFEAKGTIMVTPIFAAIGDHNGEFKVVVPFDTLKYITCTEDFVEQKSPQ